MSLIQKFAQLGGRRLAETARATQCQAWRSWSADSAPPGSSSKEQSANTDKAPESTDAAPLGSTDSTPPGSPDNAPPGEALEGQAIGEDQDEDVEWEEDDDGEYDEDEGDDDDEEIEYGDEEYEDDDEDEAEYEVVEGGEEGDIVLEAFQEQQEAYQKLLEGMKDVEVPLSLEREAVRKYAQEMEALKEKVGLPDQVELIDAVLEFEALQSGGDLRKFLHSATSKVNSGPSAVYATELLAAMDKYEATNGPLADASLETREQFASEVAKLAEAHNVHDTDAIAEEAIIDQYAEQLKSVKSKVEEDIETVKSRSGLEDINVDVASLKPKF